MKFQRFGNSFAAISGETLYVVSYYQSSWQPWYLSPGMDKPKQIGLYGFPTPELASQEAEAFQS